MNEASVTVEPVNQSNLQQAIEMAVKVFGEDDREAIEQEFKASLGMEPYRKNVTDDLNMHDLSFFIAYKNGQPVGVTGYYNFNGHEEDIWLDWIGVDPQFLRQGIGSVLVTEAFNQAAKNHTVKNFRIWTTLKSGNDAARALYRRLGYVEEPYKPGAKDGARLIVVFSKCAEPSFDDSFLWKNSAYPIDAEKYEIPKLTEELRSGTKDPSP